MQFSDIKDANGTALQSYAEVLQAKAKEAGLMTVLVFARRTDNDLDAHAMSSITGPVPQTLIALGKTMLDAEARKAK